MKQWIIGILIFFSIQYHVEAAANVYGSTGIIGTPSADAAREGQFYFGYYHGKDADSISFGAGLAKDWEISAAMIDDDRNEKNVHLNLKYALQQEGVLLPGIALGIEDIAGESDRSPYVALSKALPFGIRLHAGYGGGRYDGFFYALEKQIVPSVFAGTFPDTSLMIEHDGQDTNFGIRMSLLSGLKFNVGRHHDETYVGLTYNFY